MIYIAPGALNLALPQISRSALFGDLLMFRYCVPNAAALETDVHAPTVATGDFAQSVRAYAGLLPAPADATAVAWRVHDSVQEGDDGQYFFPLATGGTGREKRWKKGGATYARSGLHNRLYKGEGVGVLEGCIENFVPVAGGGIDSWHLRFSPGYIATAFSEFLGREPIPFWPFAAWFLRTTAIPLDDRPAALDWVQATVMSQARLGDAHVAPSRAEALDRSAWFFLGARPDPATFFDQDAPTFEGLRTLCEAYDEDRRVEAPAPGGAPGAGAAPAAAAITLRDQLLDAGGGRSLVVDDAVLNAAITHLTLGRHLLFIGPPGTGKSTLAANLARAAREGKIPGVLAPAAVHHATAAASWTSFDTLGGYVPDRSAGVLVFRPGVFMRSFRENAWLVLDELNRADADKAFGAFMGVLAGAATEQALSFEIEDAGGLLHPLRLLSGGAATTPGDVVVPEGWRMLATMNTYDKNSLFRLSYALMRRFAFVFVGALDVDTTIEAATQGVALSDPDLGRLASLLRALERAARPVGVAIAADVVRFVSSARARGDVAEPFLDAIVAYVLPQLDVLEPEVIARLLEDLLSSGVVAQGARTRVQIVFGQMLDYRG